MYKRQAFGQPAPVMNERGGIETEPERRSNVDHRFALAGNEPAANGRSGVSGALVPLARHRLLEHEGGDQERDEHDAPCVPCLLYTSRCV